MRARALTAAYARRAASAARGSECAAQRRCHDRSWHPASARHGGATSLSQPEPRPGDDLHRRRHHPDGPSASPSSAGRPPAACSSSTGHGSPVAARSTLVPGGHGLSNPSPASQQWKAVTALGGNALIFAEPHWRQELRPSQASRSRGREPHRLAAVDPALTGPHPQCRGPAGQSPRRSRARRAPAPRLGP